MFCEYPACPDFFGAKLLTCIVISMGMWIVSDPILIGREKNAFTQING